MLNTIKRFFVEKSKRDAWIAAKNKKAIIDRLEQYYRDLSEGNVYFDPKVLAQRDFQIAKENGRLDRLNRIRKKTPYSLFV